MTTLALADRSASLYVPEDLMPRAVEIIFESGVIVYDALFLALTEEADTLVITAGERLLKTLRGMHYAHLAHPCPTPAASFQARVDTP